MRARMARLLCCVLAVGLLVVCVAGAQEYALKDYMPQVVGSKWTMKQTGGRGESTLTLEVTEQVDINGVMVPVTLTKSEDGTARMGTLDLATADNYTLYGRMFGGREGGELRRMDYNPPLVFPGAMAVGQAAEATIKFARGDQEIESTVKLELAAVENVTVPKGTFEDCLKLVTTTSFGRGEMRQTTWYAKGVGQVKTERPGRGENATPTIGELVDYELATE